MLTSKKGILALVCGTVMMFFVFATGVHALEFEFGSLDLNTYTDWYGSSWGDINVVNTTDGWSGNTPVDIINGELWFSLTSDNTTASDATNYHLILNDDNTYYDPDNPNNSVYDSLTYLDYASYDQTTKTFTDGEGVNAIAPRESLINLVDEDYTQTLISPDLYITNLRFTGQAELTDFTFEDGGTSYEYTGTVDLGADNFTDGWYRISDVMSIPGSSVALKGDVPANPPVAPVPEPSTILLLATGLAGILFSRTRQSMLRK